MFDPANRTLSYASAGHPAPRLLRGGGGGLVALNRAQRLPLGIKPNEVYAEQAVPLNPGDQVVFFTDGVIEAVNTHGDVFGCDRIDAALAADTASADELLGSLLAGWSEFTAGTPVSDDRTLVVVKRNG